MEYHEEGMPSGDQSPQWMEPGVPPALQSTAPRSLERRERSAILQGGPDAERRSCSVWNQRSRGRVAERSRSRSTPRSRSRIRSSRSRSRMYPDRHARDHGERPSRRLRSRSGGRSRSRGNRRSRSRRLGDRRDRAVEPTSGRPHSREDRRSRSRFSERSFNQATEAADGMVKVTHSNNPVAQLIEAIKTLSKTHVNERLDSVHNAVPEFDPSKREQTMKMWLQKVNECASIYRWSDRQTIHYAMPKLRGVAQRWYEGLSTVLFSWEEWQRKLQTAFPSDENYGQTLSDMLAKRARFGESLENYFYEKVALINRCDITGKRAVECVLHGIDDRNVRLGAEAVQFSDPDKLLPYLRNARGYRQAVERRVVRGQISKVSEPQTQSGPARNKDTNRKPKCFNCREEGHVISQCTKPLLKCTRCLKAGHVVDDCYSTRLPPSSNSKSVLLVLNGEDTNSKYYKMATVNGVPLEAFVDFGSECCMIKSSVSKMVFSQFDTDNLPVLNGFGNSVVHTLGKRTVTVNIDDVGASVELLVVPDSSMNVPLMIGQSFTEQPHILVHKTSESLEISQLSSVCSKPNKINLICQKNIQIDNVATVEVCTEPRVSGDVFIEGSFRCPPGCSYMIQPGLYTVPEAGVFEIIVTCSSPAPVVIEKGCVISRCRLAHKDSDHKVLNVTTLKESSSESRSITEDDVSIGNDVSQHGKEELLSLLNQYRECFAFDLAELGNTTVAEMKIDLSDNEPVVYRPYRLAFKEREIVRGMVDELMANGIVRPSTSSYASPIVLVRKKTGDFRLCIDYRALNKKTIKENYPIPLIDDQLDALAGHKFYTTLDLASGYYQIPIREGDKHKTAFVTPDGHFEFSRMPFGLANAPATFQRMINQVLGSTRHGKALAYLDDVIIPSKDVKDGMETLESVLKLYKDAGLTLKLSKCFFFGEKVDYLGFEVSRDGIRPGGKKIEAVKSFPVPVSQHNIRQFLGLASFFRRFVRGFSVIAKPLTRLLKKDVEFKWGDEQEAAFRALQEALVQKPTLALYNPHAETELHTDASKLGIAGILLQKDENGLLKPVAYFSRQTTPEEQNYSSYDLETLAVIGSLQKFRVYLIGVRFKVVTDCNSLRATFLKRDMIPRVARWWSQMQEYDFNIEYKAGKSMAHVDALSRNPVQTNVAELQVRNVTEADWLVTVQSADSEVQRIVGILQDPNLNDIVDIRSNYKQKNGKLFRVTERGDRWVVPKGVRWQVVKQNHDDIGHFAVDKTLEKLQATYWFAKMRSFVKKYVGSCLECAYSKSAGGKRPGFLHPIEKVDQPFHTVHVDHVGPFVRSSKGSMHILVMIDAFTRYIYVRPVRNTKTLNTVRILRDYFGIFGVPKRLISDRGTSFTSTSFKRFIVEKGIKHILNAVSTPRANGQVERYNKTIIESLTTKCVGTNDNKWDEHLPEVQWGLNNTFNKGIGCTPSEALFGMRLTGPSERSLITALSEDDQAVYRLGNVDQIRDQINDHVANSQLKQKNTFDKSRCSPPTYKEGDLVRVERQLAATGHSRKLIPRYQGPYRIVKAYKHDRYQIEATPLTRKGNKNYSNVVAVDKIKPWLNFARPHDVSSGNESENTE